MKRIIIIGYLYCLRGFYFLYTHLVIIPYFRINENLKKPFEIKRAFNSVVILDQNRVFKASLNRGNTLEREYINYKKSIESFPSLIKISPEFNRVCNSVISYLASTRYRELEGSSSIDAAIVVYELFRQSQVPERRLAISDSAELIAGLAVISSLYGNKTSRQIEHVIDSYLKNASYHIGFSHGDFHSRNIVVDDRSNPRLLDFDCVRLTGIQELDALYYMVELEWSRSGIMWYETIAAYIRGDISGEESTIMCKFDFCYNTGLAVTFFVDRIGQETRNFGGKYTTSQMDSAISAALEIHVGP